MVMELILRHGSQENEISRELSMATIATTALYTASSTEIINEVLLAGSNTKKIPFLIITLP